MSRAPAAADVRVRTAGGFDEPTLRAGGWDRLLELGTDVVFLTHAWQQLWWTARREQQLMLILAERDGETVALAPLYESDAALMFVGSGGADYLDFIGRPDEQALWAMLEHARAQLPELAAIELYHVPADSPTSAMLPGVAARLGLDVDSEPEDGAPWADLGDAGLVERLTSRRSIRKEQARMRRAAPLLLRAARPEELEELVELFLRQHGERWRAAGERSFDRESSRELVRTVVQSGVREGWALLTVLEWDGAPAAIDISLRRRSVQLSWLVSRDPSIAGYSPGRVLRAHVIGEAVAAGMQRFDFGLGEEDYKLRDCSGVRRIANWFMYS